MSSDEGPSLRVRTSLRELCKDDKKLNAFLRAFKHVTELPPDNPNSFWNIGGYHGEPFDKKPQGTTDPTANAWGGYCQHENVLFPTWHRMYTLRLEQALRTVCPKDDVTFPYWDQTSEESLKFGLPDILTKDTVLIDGEEVRNPLKSFTFPLAIEGGEADEYYHKPKGYATVRYPFSGICSPPEQKKLADKHNSDIYHSRKNVDRELDQNIIYSLNGPKDTKWTPPPSIKDQYVKCLATNDYNSFSNTTSARVTYQMPLEQPHNKIHLAIGGYSLYGEREGQIEGANGDMGENETAAFDPVFFFHHCNIDRVFWIWQKQHEKTNSLEIDPADSGTIPANGQGPTPGQKPKEHLQMDTVLYPFQQPNGYPSTSNDCVNIETQLGYTYSKGSLEDSINPVTLNVAIRKVKYFKEINTILEVDIEKAKALQVRPKLRFIFDISNIQDKLADIPNCYPNLTLGSGNVNTVTTNFIKVHNINKDLYPGSFLVRAFYKDLNKLIGESAILDRWNAAKCSNCQTHRMIDVVFDVSKYKIPMRPKVADIIVQAVYFNPKTYRNETKLINADKIYAGEDQPAQTFVVVCTET